MYEVLQYGVYYNLFKNNWLYFMYSYVKFKTVLKDNLLNYKNGSSHTDYAGNVADNCSSWTESR